MATTTRTRKPAATPKPQPVKAAPTAKPAPAIVFGVTSVDRFRSPKCDEAKHANSHITKQAAIKCGGKGTEVTELTTVSRYWGTKDGARCSCKFGHRSEASAVACVGGPKASEAPAAKAAPKTPAAKPTPAKARTLRAVTEGSGQRA